MLCPTYPLLTERLLIRPFESDDFVAMCELQGRPDVSRYMYWDTRSPEEVRRPLSSRINLGRLERPGDCLILAAVLAQNGCLIGELKLEWLDSEHRQGEIGFVFHPDHQGKGLAKEASVLLLKMGFVDAGFHRITGRCDARNEASAGLMERLGMRREAHLRENEFVKGEWCDEYTYAILDREWANLA